MTPAIATALAVKTQSSALITAIEPMGPAHGLLQVEDVLLRIGTVSVTVAQLPKIAARLIPGTRGALAVIRDGVELSIPFTVGQLPDPPSDPSVSGGPDAWVTNLALGLADTRAEVRKALKADNEPSGLIVTQLRAAGAGALAGLRIGDLISHAGSKQLTAVTDLATVDMPSLQQPLVLRVVRDGSPSFVAVTGSELR
jgi:S1-C subfamily serine protease